MATPKGMKWIDLTYLTERIDDTRGDGIFQAEACMQVLVDASAADCLVYGGDIADIKMPYVLSMVRAREQLCRGRYVEDSLVIRIVEGDDG